MRGHRWWRVTAFARKNTRTLQGGRPVELYPAKKGKLAFVIYHTAAQESP